MSLFRRKPKRSSRAELVDIFAAGREPEPAPQPAPVEWAWLDRAMPCGYLLRVQVEPVAFDEPYDPPWNSEELMRDLVAEHEDTCNVCHASVSHPDFDLEWTA